MKDGVYNGCAFLAGESFITTTVGRIRPHRHHDLEQHLKAIARCLRVGVFDLSFRLLTKRIVHVVPVGNARVVVRCSTIHIHTYMPTYKRYKNTISTNRLI